MIWIKRIYLTFSLLVWALFSEAQPEPAYAPVMTPGEQICPFRSDISLKHNAVIAKTVLDTISLPFVDDFSDYSGAPNTALWADNFAYVNQTYGLDPVTVGVATFDGLDDQGQPYSNNATSNGICDYLSSHAIDLSSYSIADSIYLTFFFQPEGLGEKPENTDSLHLEFFDINGNWVNMWSYGGSAVTPFFQVYTKVDAAIFFHSGFRFRFYNFGNQSGKLDHWHIDYVVLNDKRRLFEPILEDVAFRTVPNQLMNVYYEMPWSHFQAGGHQLLAGKYKIVPYNLDRTNSFFPNYSFAVTQKPSGFIVNSQSGGQRQILPETRDTLVNFSGFTVPLGNVADSMVINMTYGMSLTADRLQKNNTFSKDFHFFNHFAYDDGSAEYGMGLNVSGAQLVNKYILYKPDTLRGIQFYFSPIQENLDSFEIELRIYKHIAEPSTGLTDELIYSKTMYIDYQNTINGFQLVEITDTILAVTDSFYVGWKQSTNKLLNIGLDRNTDSKNMRFFNVSGNWQKSAIDGSMMIRPIVSSKNVLGTSVTQALNKNLQPKFFPNPTNSILNFSNLPYKSKIGVYNLMGQLEIEVINSSQVDLGNLPAGVYFIKVMNSYNELLLIDKCIKL